MSMLGVKASRDDALRRLTYGFLARQAAMLRASEPRSTFSTRTGISLDALAQMENVKRSVVKIDKLFEYAEALDIAVLVRFVDWQTFLMSQAQRSNPAALAPQRYDAGYYVRDALEKRPDFARGILYGA